MLRVALAILVLAPALLQDDGKKQDPKKRERELAARIEKIESQLSRAEGEDERARLTRELDKARAELDQLRAGTAKEVEKKVRVDADELRRRCAELQDHLRNLHAKLERTEDEKSRDAVAAEIRKCESEHERVQNQLRAMEKGRPPFGDRPPDGPPPPGREFRDVDMERVLQFAREFEPGTQRKLEQLIREKRHEDAMRVAREAMPRLQQMEELKATNPDGFKRQQEIAAAERDAWTLSDKLRKSEGDDRPRMRDDLLKALGRLFEMREAARAKELEELEKRVAELKAMLRKRQENKDKIIEKRAQEMVGEEFEW